MTNKKPNFGPMLQAANKRRAKAQNRVHKRAEDKILRAEVKLQEQEDAVAQEEADRKAELARRDIIAKNARLHVDRYMVRVLESNEGNTKLISQLLKWVEGKEKGKAMAELESNIDWSKLSADVQTTD